MKVDVVWNWLDYLALAGTLLSVLTALVALIIARESASDSKRSAEAAHETAQVARDQLEILKTERAEREAELARRPKLVPNIRVLRRDDSPEHGANFLVEVSVQNVGDRIAENTLMTLMCGEGIRISTCNAKGNDAYEQTAIPQDQVKLLVAGKVGAAHSISSRLRVDQGGARMTLYYRLLIPETPGKSQVWAIFTHPEIDERVLKILEVWMPQPGQAIGARSLDWKQLVGEVAFAANP